MKQYVLYFILGMLFTACSSEQPVQEKTVVADPVQHPSLMVKARFECEELVSPEEGEPQAVVQLQYNEVQHTIDTISTCSIIAPEMYRNYDIPKQALSACGGWWAGHGTFLYVINEGDSSLAVWEAQRARAQDTVPFTYQEKVRIPLQKN